MTDTIKNLVGHAEEISFPELGLFDVPARIDTGARTSAVSVSEAALQEGRLKVVFSVNPANKEACYFDEFEKITVTNSTGHVQERFKVSLQVTIRGKKIRAGFTLADRSTQVYPVLIGRNVLRGKFVVDVKHGYGIGAKARAVRAGMHTKKGKAV